MSSWDDEAGFDRNDPKHPDWHSVHADLWDNRDKFACVPDESAGLADEEKP